MDRKGQKRHNQNPKCWRCYRQMFFPKNVFESFLSSEPVAIQQIGKLIRLRLEAADKRLDGYTLEIKWITRSTDS